MPGGGDAGGEGHQVDAWMEDDLDLDDLKEKHQQEGLFTVVDSFLKSAKEGLFGVLFTMSKKPSKSMSLAVLAMVIDFLQLSSFALPHKDELDYNFGPMLAVLAETVSYSRFGLQLKNAFGVFPILLVFLSLVTLELLNVAYVAYAWVKKDFKHLWAIKVMRATISLFVGILFIPILSVFSNVFTCSGLEKSTCTILLPITLMIMAVFILIGVAVSLSYFDAMPTSRSPFALPHSRISTLHLLVKAVYAITFAFVKSSEAKDSFKPYWSLLVALPATGLATLFVWYQPYFNTRVSAFRATLSCVLSWFAWCGYFQAAFGDEGSNVLAPLFITGTIVMIPLALFAVETRRYSLVFMPLSSCKNSFEVELKGRFYLLGYGGSFDDTDESAVRERAVEVNKWYKEALLRFPASSALCVFHAHLAMDYLSSKTTILVRKAIVSAERRGIAPDLQFTVYKAKAALEQTADTSNVMQYVRYEKYLREASEQDAKCCVQLIKFWGELGRRHPSVQGVRDLALAIGNTSAAAKSAYTNLLTLSPDSPQILRQFGTFMVDVVNDSKSGNAMLMKAARMDRKEAMIGGRPKTLDDIRSGTVGMLLVHLEEADRIESSLVAHANMPASKIFNEDSRSLSQKCILTLMAKPADEALKSAFIQFVQEGDDQYFEEEYESFMADSNETCFQVTMKLKPFFAGDLNFSTYINFIGRPETADKACYLLLDEDDTVSALSRSMANIMGTLSSLHDTLGIHSVHVDKLIPSFMENAFDIVDRGMERTLKFHLPTAPKSGRHHVADDDLADSSAGFFEAEVSAKKIDFMGTTIRQIFVLPAADSGVKVAFAGQGDHDGDGDSDGGLSFASSRAGGRMGNQDNGQSGYGGSEAGSESISSQNMMKRQAARVRRVLLEQENSSMDPSLVGLSRIYILVCLVVCVVVIEECVSWTESLHEYSDNLSLLDRIGTRTSFMVSIAYGAHSIELFNLGYPGVTQHEVDLAREEIEHAAVELKHIDSELFELSSHLPDEIRTLYDERRTAYDYLDNGKLQIDKLGLYEATLQISSQAIQATNMPTEVFWEDEPVFFALMNNLRYDNTSVLTRFLDTSKAYQHYVHDKQIEKVKAAELTSLSIGSVIIVLIGFVSWRLLGNNRKIESTTHEVVDVFLGIEKATAVLLSGRYAERLNQVHQSSEYANDKALENPRDRRFSVSSTHTPRHSTSNQPENATKRSAKIQPTKEEQTQPPRPAVRGKAKKAASSRIQQGKRQKCCSARRIIILLKVGSFLLVSGAYFLSLTLFGENISHSLKAAPGIVRHSTLRKGKAREVHHAMRLWLTGTYANHSYPSPKGGVLEFEIYDSDVRERVEELNTEHKKILYGSEEDDIPGLFNGAFGWNTASQLWLNTEDACYRFKESENTTVDDCKSFMHGLLTGGLHTALTKYMKTVKAVTNNPEIKGVLESGNKTAIKKLLLRKDVLELFELEEVFIQPQLQTAVDFHTSAITQLLYSGQLYVGANLAAFLILSVIVYTMVIRPLLLQLDTEVKRTRSLLLIIPEDVLETLRHVQVFMVKHFASQA